MDDVREKHGVRSVANDANSQAENVTLTERAQCVQITIYDGIGKRDAFITPNEARHLATKLHRLAGRVATRV